MQFLKFVILQSILVTYCRHLGWYFSKLKIMEIMITDYFSSKNNLNLLCIVSLISEIKIPLFKAVLVVFLCNKSKNKKISFLSGMEHFERGAVGQFPNKIPAQQKML